MIPRIAPGGDAIRPQCAEIYCWDIFDNGGIVIQVADVGNVNGYLLEILMVRRDGFESLGDPFGSEQSTAEHNIFTLERSIEPPWPSA